jgi:hypothetical protein
MFTRDGNASGNAHVSRRSASSSFIKPTLVDIVISIDDFIEYIVHHLDRMTLGRRPHLLRTWHALAFGLIFLPISASAQCPANYQKYFPHKGEAHCEELSDDTWQWRIVRPIVDQRLTEYPDIQFAKGEVVFVSASGCVNTKMHHGHDWRRYVDPVGPDTDRLYHGLIWIPGAGIWRGKPLVTAVGTDLVRISSISSISKGEPSQPEQLIIGNMGSSVGPWLRLGYEADVLYEEAGYDGDNGYYDDHDNHCEKVKQDAEILITVTNRPHNDEEPSRKFLPFDPVATRTDGNGFMDSPIWFGSLGASRRAGADNDVHTLSVSADCGGFPYKKLLIRVSYGVETQCTQQASYDEPTEIPNSCLFAPELSQFHGHVNWVTATYVGKLRFQDFSPDGDLDFQLLDFVGDDRALRFSNLQPQGHIGQILTRDSQQEREYKDAIWMEFAGYEVTEHFRSIEDHQPTPLGWQLFYNPKDVTNGPPAKQVEAELKRRFLDRTAVVTGLLNLDCVHDCHTELHPVLAMAIRAKCELTDALPGGVCTSRHSESAIKNERKNSILEDDPWMIFVRTQGNEGDCAKGQHYLDRTEFSFFLPAPLNAKLFMPQLISGSFQSNVGELTWELREVSDGLDRGVQIVFHLVPVGHNLADGAPVRINGVLRLNWTSTSTHRTPPTRDNCPLMANCDQYEVAEQRSTETAQGNVTPPSEQPQERTERVREYDKRLRGQESGQHLKSKPHFLDGLKAMGDYWHWNFSAFQEVLLYHDFSQVAPDIGGRFQVLTTSLGAFEVEGAVGIPRTITSSTGQRVTVDANNVMAGPRFGLTQKFHAYMDIKGGALIRSASPGFGATPEFKHFTGSDGFVYFGVGIQPRGDENQFSVRLGVGIMWVPTTDELLLRLTAGPVIRRLPHMVFPHRSNL